MRTVTTQEANVLIRRRNRSKIFRNIAQYLLLAAIIAYAIFFVTQPKTYAPIGASVNEGVETASTADSRFIAVSYSGITKSESASSTIVSQRAFAEQMRQLKASGYVTITQQDVLNYYRDGAPLPRRALFLMFEDGILNTTTFAQSTLEELNYIATACTYAQNLGDANSKFLSDRDLRNLVGSSFWELGVNGYRLSYINVFDRYDNYFGDMNTNEYVQIRQYLERNYNHYLMDFLRDEDGLRVESNEELASRIAEDYSLMKSIYTEDVGALPGMYVLMHSNTGAFGTDDVASGYNGKYIRELFDMNFNRQGSCLNTRESSLYDLTRFQPQAYYSTNHMLMRIYADTGDEMAFLTGDEAEAEKWFVDKGVAQFNKDNIILTTLPEDEGRMALRSLVLEDLDLSTTLNGAIVGVQSVSLRADRELRQGLQVSLESNVLVVRDLAAGTELAHVDLFDFDGGATKSEEEDEREGLIALQDAIIAYDDSDDAERILQAIDEKSRLMATSAPSLEEGGTPYEPALDISDLASRKLRVLLKGTTLNVWIDGKPAIVDLTVPQGGLGNVVLGASVRSDGKYSQRNLYDTVYDAEFLDLTIRDAENSKLLYYQYTLSDWQRVTAFFTDVFDQTVNFFSENF